MISLDTHITKMDNFWNESPFPHAYIKDFWDTDVAENLHNELPLPDSDKWNGYYNNQIEYKKTLNIWDNFDTKIYQAFTYLCSQKFTDWLSNILDIPNLIPDVGLHGGGLHYYPRGGKLNPHIDYAHHPKLSLRRKINLLVYLNKDWKKSHGGQLGLWSEDQVKQFNPPEKLIDPEFNNCIIFENTDKSYHGLVTSAAAGRYSMAMYYLIDDCSETEHKKARFLPTQSQKDNPEVKKLIEQRKTQRIVTMHNKILRDE